MGSEGITVNSNGHAHKLIPVQLYGFLPQVALPEGRVHGGNIMAMMLSGSSSVGPSNI